MSIKEISLEIVPASAGLPEEQAQTLTQSFQSFLSQAETLKEKALAVTEPKEARNVRLELKAVRVAADKKREELKKDALRYGNAVQGAYNIILHLVQPLEESLEEIEKKAEREAAEKARLILEKRTSEILAHGGNPGLYNLNCGEQEYAVIIKSVIELEVSRAEEAKRIEEAKAKAAEEERLERIRIAEENAKLKAEADKRDKELAEERAKLKAVQDEANRKAKAEADKRAEEEKAEKAKAKAPDKQKILYIAQTLRDLDLGTLSTNEGRELQTEIKSHIERLAALVEKKAQDL